jgi:para-aminobenzoate synthetase component 1
MKILTLPYLNPELIFAKVANNVGTIFLDSSMSHEYYGRYSYIVINPIKYYRDGDIFQDVIVWQNILAENAVNYDASLPPFIGGLVGYFSYDLVQQIEQVKMSNEKVVPNYIFGLYTQVFAFDNIDRKLWIIINDIDQNEILVQQQLDKMLKIYHNAVVNNVDFDIDYLQTIKFDISDLYNDYINNIIKAKNYIFSGDIFEVNITQKFSTIVDNCFNCFNVYQNLRNINPAPFSAYINFDDLIIMSSSPERFMQIFNREVEVRPIKGTIKRYEDLYLDQLQKERLKNSEKDRAENIMIVDLMRNDLSIICEAESVIVKNLCQVESYTNLHHLVSVIIGKLKDRYSVIDAFLKCFPAGSITGAPKIRSMEIIDELESFKRGVYCGSIGYFSFNQTVDFSVAIRTIIKNNNELSFYSGGAITLDSNPEEEYKELMVKAYNIIKLFDRNYVCISSK